MATHDESRYEDAQSKADPEQVVVSIEEGAEVGNGVSRVVSDSAAVLQRGHGGRALLERDDSVEWRVFEDPSTASIRHKLFERSVSIQPER